MESLFYPFGPSPARGRQFEAWVDCRLTALQRLFPTVVSIARQEPLDLSNGLRTIPDFRLEVVEPEGKQIRIIECQHRRRITNAIVQKCKDMRIYGRYNRFMLVYGDERYLTSRATRALEADGLVHYDADGFIAFLSRLAWKLYRLDPDVLGADDTARLHRNLEDLWRLESPKRAAVGTALLAEDILTRRTQADPSPFTSSSYRADLWQLVKVLKRKRPKDEGMLGGR